MRIAGEFAAPERIDGTPGPTRRASKQQRRLRLYGALMASDSLCLLLGFGLAGSLHPLSGRGLPGLHMAALILPIYLGVALNSYAYGYSSLAKWKVGLGRALLSLMFSIAAIVFVAFYAKASMEFSRLVFGIGSVTSTGFLIGGRYLFRGLVARSLGTNLRSELVIVDGCDSPTIEQARVIEATAHGLRPDPRDPMMLDRLGRALMDIDYVVVCCRAEDRPAWSLLLKGTNVPASILAPELAAVSAHRITQFHGNLVMEVTSGPLDLRSRAIKRMMDLAITVPALIAISPLLLIVAAAIKLDSRGPVFFKQERLGRGNRLFRVYKFRSMRAESCDLKGDRSASRDDDRITRIGRIIRATSIDELPQLLNVLHGDMSLVGPRPHALGSTAGMELFWDVDQRYWHRHALKPGITGLAQVRGFRGATHERIDLVRRLQADLEYMNGWTIWRDLGILLATARVMVHPNAF